MSKRETPMTRWYWQQVGGTLIEEFCAVRGSRSSCGVRRIDGVIIKGGPTIIKPQSGVSVEGKDIIVVQAKANRLGMSVMGQAFFSTQLLQKFKPRSVESVVLVFADDEILRPLFEQYPGMHVVVCPASLKQLIKPANEIQPDQNSAS